MGLNIRGRSFLTLLDFTTEEINYLLDLNPNKIVYVSCDPVTLACDLKKLKEMYNIKDIKLFNMFPRTEHVETVCLLERR